MTLPAIGLADNVDKAELAALFSKSAHRVRRPALECDLIVDDCATNLSLVLGITCSSGLAVSVSADRLGRIDPLAQLDDRLLLLSVSYQFGRPPPDR